MLPSDRMPDSTLSSERNETDASLEVERSEADRALAVLKAKTEQAADTDVRAARRRADAMVEDARDETDNADHVPIEAQRERVIVDRAIEEERAATDAALRRERAKLRRPMDQLFAVERDQTDQHLDDERGIADFAIAARDEFLAVVSHDLRSLLGTISLNADALCDAAPKDASGEVMRLNAARTERLVARCDRLIHDLLDVTSIEAGKLAVTPQPHDLLPLVAEIVESFRAVASRKSVRLEASSDRDVVMAQLDRDRILQVLANLVSNAIKFTPAGGTIEIRTSSANGSVEVAVRDTGIGIEPEKHEVIFERFRQIANRERHGLGLGLHISKSIIEAHGGRIWVDSVVGAGSTFHFTLPPAK